jgi:hypothetical protein
VGPGRGLLYKLEGRDRKTGYKAHDSKDPVSAPRQTSYFSEGMGVHLGPAGWRLDEENTTMRATGSSPSAYVHALTGVTCTVEVARWDSTTYKVRLIVASWHR